ncbi:hypothetical protein ACFXJ8_44070 [Nonomuraea sp. NPDC059194]|uniref:hypothetical protein n=1 Tax=Nonomuraea sp. NPDC059194 TaxID=3346764 RepID=UPI003688A0A9
MTSWASRYRSGDHVAVWNDLRAFGSAGVPESLREDAEDVASETMRRVAANVDVLVDRLSSAGYAFASPETVRQAPTEDDFEAIAKAEAVIGPLPVALRACLEIVGAVDLCGDGGSMLPHVRYHAPPREPRDLYPDPLVLHSGRMLWDMLSSTVGDVSLGCACTDPEEDELCGFHANGFFFSIAPDGAAKANFSGGDHCIRLPNANPDPPLRGIPVSGSISLVEYLRRSLAWGGFPGYAIRPVHVPPPALLERLRSQLRKF